MLNYYTVNEYSKMTGKDPGNIKGRKCCEYGI